MFEWLKWFTDKTPITRGAATRAFAILFVLSTLGLGANYEVTRGLCRESHQRYSAISGTIKGAFSITKVERQRLTPDQLTEVASYNQSKKDELLGKLGSPPTC